MSDNPIDWTAEEAREILANDMARCNYTPEEIELALLGMEHHLATGMLTPWGAYTLAVAGALNPMVVADVDRAMIAAFDAISEAAGGGNTDIPPAFRDFLEDLGDE